MEKEEKQRLDDTLVEVKTIIKSGSKSFNYGKTADMKLHNWSSIK